MTVFLRPAAAAEIDDAYRWYEKQRPSLGEERLTEFGAILDTIESSPARYRVVHRDTRRALLPRFPYAVLYRVRAPDLVVIAFFHGSRDPRHWRSRK